MKRLTLPKVSRLCSESAIEALFNRSSRHSRGKKRGSYVCFPLRAVWIEENFRHDEYKGTRFLISVPKKKLRHAVDRVKMRRRIREVWRLNRPHPGPNIDIALIYMTDKIESYESILYAVTKILSKLPNETPDDETNPAKNSDSAGPILSTEHLTDVSGELSLHSDM